MTRIKTIYFRADGGQSMGWGHVVRSMALASMLKEEFRTVLVSASDTPFAHQQAREAGADVIIVNNDSQFPDVLSDQDVVVVDGYHFQAVYLKDIRTRGAKLVCIDDLHIDTYDADAVINHNPAANKLNYPRTHDTRLLLGFDYALLRKPFLEAARVSRPRTSFDRLMICMGGTDPHNLTSRALAVAVSSGVFSSIDVVTRTGQELGDFPVSVQRHSELEAVQMSNLMTQNDIVIAPASSLSFEAISSRICLICGHFEPNQRELYEYLDKNQIAFGAGDFRSLNEEGLQRVIAGSIPFFKRQDRSRRLIDGQQDARFKRAFRALTR